MPSSEILSNPAVEQQLKDLEAEYSRRKAAIEQTPEGAPEHEQKIVRDIVREKINAGAPALTGPAPTSGDAAKDPEIMAKVQEVVNITFSAGLDAAVKKLKEINNPAVTDEYHKAISGQFYKILRERKKIKEM